MLILSLTNKVLKKYLIPNDVNYKIQNRSPAQNTLNK